MTLRTMMDKKKTVVALLLVASASLAGCTNASSNPVTMETTPEISDVISFAGSSVPEGWATQDTGGTGINATVDTEHPASSTKDKCYFSRTVEYLPKGYANRGDDYNSKQFVYDMGASFKNENLKIDPVTVKTPNGDLSMLSSSISYDDQATGKTTTRFAARVISSVKKSGYEVTNAPENPYAQNSAEGIPVVFLKADCIGGQTISDEEWKTLLSLTTVTLDGTTPAASPSSVDLGPLKPAPVMSPSVSPDATMPTATEAPDSPK